MSNLTRLSGELGKVLQESIYPAKSTLPPAHCKVPLLVILLYKAPAPVSPADLLLTRYVAIHGLMRLQRRGFFQIDTHTSFDSRKRASRVIKKEREGLKKTYCLNKLLNDKQVVEADTMVRLDRSEQGTGR